MSIELVDVVKLLEKQQELTTLRIKNKIDTCMNNNIDCSTEDRIAYMTAVMALKELRVELIDDYIGTLKLINR